MDSTASKQFALLKRMSALADPPCIMGGYAEDALLAGTVTRPHGDIDWLFARRELDFRLEQAKRLGFERLDTWGEAAPSMPFYLSGDNGELRLEIGVMDEADGDFWIGVHKLFFDLDGREPPAGYRVRCRRTRSTTRPPRSTAFRSGSRLPLRSTSFVRASRARDPSGLYRMGSAM